MIGVIPIVSLDKIFTNSDNTYFIDCTRLENSSLLIPKKEESVIRQIEIISKNLKDKEIILVDDVVFSGSVLRKIIKLFEKYNVKVVKVVSSISTKEGYEYFSNNLKYGMETNYLLNKETIDQICERDFYFGICGSGIMTEKDKKYYKAPYFKPFGNPCERASIPKEYEISFSKSCLERSIYLWDEIDRNKKEKTKIKDLPERIINTDKNEEVVKALKKELRRL